MRGEILEGRYRLEEVLGAGGMGQVWRAVDHRLDRDVAVKVILTNPLAEESLAARFHQEARSTARLTHRHIVTIHDYGEAELSGGPVLFLVMELVQGRSLATFVTAKRPDVACVVDWGAQICTGLAAAHRGGLVHRDIKPANVMVYGEEERDLKICDFGIARVMGETGLTRTGSAIGTPAYMSPEQARGDRTIDGRSDLYSLGCLLYELLAGVPPFEGTGWAVVTKHLAEQPRPVRALRPEVPSELDELILRLLHKDPAHRPGSAAEVAQTLSGLLADLEQSPPDARRPARTARSTEPGPPASAPTPASAPESTPKPAPAPVMPARMPAFAPAPAPRTAGTGRRAGAGTGTGAGLEPRQGRAPARPMPPGSTRTSMLNGLIAGGLLFTQFSLLTSWSPFWALLVCAAAFLTVSLATYAGDPSSNTDPADESCLSTPLTAFVGAVLVSVFLLFWPPSPWWTGVVFLFAGTAALVAVGLGVRKAVIRTTGRIPWCCDAGTAAGLFNGTVVFMLLAAGGRTPLLLSVAAGLVVCAVLAPLVTLLLPRLPERAPAD
ncbi:protein kinase [Streptomyces sp. NPDC004111]|uniref:serine/threonine-protein kinase n=1 Tax=Streptomyces sp. NPDC004111 TaxID=3364690 RepID=UPI00369B7DFE